MTTPEQISPGSPQLRPLGSLIAVTISIVIAAGGLVINAQTGWIAGLLGMPVVAVLGWRMSDEMAAATGRHVLAVALWFGARTILVAAAIVTIVLILGTGFYGLGWVVDGHSLAEVPLYLIAGAVALVALGVLYYLAGLALIGLPMLAVVLPAALVWAVVFRAVITKPAAQATRTAS
jgi:hypothetical protein